MGLMWIASTSVRSIGRASWEAGSREIVEGVVIEMDVSASMAVQRGVIINSTNLQIFQ